MAEAMMQMGMGGAGGGAEDDPIAKMMYVNETWDTSGLR